jgi:pyruvate dehydrogenase (quinone)
MLFCEGSQVGVCRITFMSDMCRKDPAMRTQHTFSAHSVCVLNHLLQLPVKVIVFKNDALAFVELEMKAAGIVDFGTDLDNPNFAKMAEAAGLLGLTAETPDQVEPMIAQALQHDGPALVEVLVSRQELSMPPTITLEQAKGFSLFMLRAVLSGRGDEIIDLAKVNLLR